MQKICNLIRWNSVHISHIFNCYSVYIKGMWNTKKLVRIYKIFEFIATDPKHARANYHIITSNVVTTQTILKNNLFGKMFSRVLTKKSSRLENLGFFSDMCKKHLRNDIRNVLFEGEKESILNKYNNFLARNCLFWLMY